MTNRTPTTDQILADPCVSFWAKQAIRDLDKRDICDAMRDVELLTRCLDEKWAREQLAHDDDDTHKAMQRVSPVARWWDSASGDWT